MTVEEIFSRLSSHGIRGMMIHEQMANYYDFLGLDGYKQCHDYHYICETLDHRKLQKFFVSRYNKLIPDSEIDSSSVIPQNWYKYTRQNVDKATKKSAVETGVNEWVNWERQTRAVIAESYKMLRDLGETIGADFVLEMLKENEEEVKKAEKALLELDTAGYDLTYIVDCQHRLCKKYKKKMEELA